jgi:uncharacterized iron-regulated protein
MGKNGSKIIAAQVSRELAERLERTAAEQERSVSAEIRVALCEHLAARQPRVHEQERQVA